MRNTAAVMFSFIALGGTVFSAGIPARSAPAAPAPAEVALAGAVQIVQPFNKAVVRESVPIMLRDFPAGGYVSVSIDGKFVTAQALPQKQNAPVYVWDTKGEDTDPDNSTTPKTYNDGPHALTLAVYTAQNKLVGQDSVSVQLANKINLPASEGIKLTYPWKTGLTLRYQRRTTLTAVPTEASSTASVQVLQQSLLRFQRSVENAEGDSSLIRDEIIPVDKSVKPKAFVSYVATHGQSVALTSGVHAEYREVDARGQVLSRLASQNTANSIGFSIPVLPPRRVSAGAHWESPVKITLDWTSPYPTTVQATSTLEDFEWQDRYPTAKIRETYAGPATFFPGPGSAVPAIQSQGIKFERIIYFAYNAGRVVRTQTTLTLTSAQPGLLNSTPGLAGSPDTPPGGYPGNFNGRGGYQPGGYPGGYQGGPPRESPPTYDPYDQPAQAPGGEYPPGVSPGGEYPPGASPGGEYPPGASPGQSFGPPGAYPGQSFGPPEASPGPPGAYPGRGGYSGQYGQIASPTKLTYSETAVLLT
jgi:hypothetical protein